MSVRTMCRFFSVAIVCLVACGIPSVAKSPKPVATFSIVALDKATGELGVAVQSKFFAVGSVVPYAQADVGAVATQSFANVRYGPEGLKLMKSCKSAKETVRILTEADDGRAKRQVGMVDAQGKSASFTGEECLDWAGHIAKSAFCVQGNILVGEEVVTAMARAFEKARDKGEGELADWLMAAMAAGQAAGGDRRGRQSAAMLVVREGGGYEDGNDRYIDLRVDDHAEPIKELGRLLEIHKNFYRRARSRRDGRNQEKEENVPSDKK